jgi:hypothetical protein
MTSEEYRALQKEYFESDSISRREEIEDAIYHAAAEMFVKVRDIFDKYHARKDLIYDDYYRDDRGWMSLAHEDDGEPIIEKESILLHYGDHWAHGGECGFGIRVYAKWFDAEGRKQLAEELRKKRIERLESMVESLEKEIASKEEQLQKCVGEYNALKAGGDPDDIDTIEDAGD